MKDAERVDDGDEMPGPARWRRRDVLLAATAIAGTLLAVPPIVGSGREPVVAGNALLKRVLQALGHGIDSNELVASASVDLQLARILRVPAAVFASQAPTANDVTSDLKQLIRHNIEADYRAGEIRVVNGWWLSATEASCLELIGTVSDPRYANAIPQGDIPQRC
jgi:hypothetical protein